MVFVGTIPPMAGLNPRQQAVWTKTNKLIIERGGYELPTYDDLVATVSADVGCL